MDTALLTVLVTGIPVVAGALGIWWQIRRQTLAHSAVLLISLEEQFRSKELTEDRKRLALKIQEETQKSDKDGDLRGYWPVIAFLDNLGVMVRRKAIDEELVWKRFGWRITRCYIALKSGTNLLENTRTYYKQPSMYDQFEWLAQSVLKHNPSMGVSLTPTRATEEYVEQEMGLIPDSQHLALTATRGLQ